MATLYPVDGHPLLSERAHALAPDALAEQAALAEELLGFTTAALFTGDDAARARRAVALQVSFQVERGIEANVYANLTRGSRSFEYAAAAGLLHPVAEEIAALLVPAADAAAGTYSVIRSLR